MMLGILRRGCLQWRSTQRLAPACNIFGRTITGQTSPSDELEDEGFQAPVHQSQETFKSLWSKIQTCHSNMGAVEVVKQWKEEGNEFSKELMHGILNKLCARSWFTQADRFANWLDEQKAYELTEEDELFRLQILCRRGDRWNKAWKMLEDFPHKTEEAYLVMLNASTTSLETWRAEKVMKALQESKLMTTGRAYTAMIRMYIRMGKTEKALATYKEFEASGLPDDAAMYWYLLSYKDTIFKTVPAVEKAKAAVEKLGSDAGNRREAMKIYALLGDAEALDRVWSEMKAAGGSKLWKADYLVAITCYDAIGKLDVVEEIYKQLEEVCEGDVSYRNKLFMLRVYARNANIPKAEAVLEEISEKPSFEQCHPMIEGYVKAGELEKAVECFSKYIDVADSTNRRRRGRQIGSSMVKMNEEFAKRGDVRGAEKVLAKVPYMDRVEVFNSLLKVYLSAKTPAYAFERRMEAVKAVPNEETKALLAQLEALEYGNEGKENVAEGETTAQGEKVENATEGEKSEKNLGEGNAEEEEKEDSMGFC